MKKIIIILTILIALMAISCASKPPMKTEELSSAKPVETREVSESISQDTNMVPVRFITPLYEYPSSISEKLVVISANSMVKITSFQGAYFMAEHNGKLGYIDKDDVVINKKIQEIIDDYKQRERDKESNKIKIKQMKTQLESNKAWIKILEANIRQSPSASSEIVGMVWRGTEVFIQEEKGEWYKVSYGGPSDYFLKLYNDIDELTSAYKKGWAHKSLISKSMIRAATELEKDGWQFVKEHPHMPQKYKDAILKGTVIIGMSKDMVIVSLGNPNDINRSVGSWGVKEQWVYGGGVYLYFKNDKLTSWQD